jgi:hypothetical protein
VLSCCIILLLLGKAGHMHAAYVPRLVAACHSSTFHKRKRARRREAVQCGWRLGSSWPAPAYHKVPARLLGRPPRPRLQVTCSNLAGKNISYSQVQGELRQARFCLIPPGDTQSSNRLTETVLNGCIPVVSVSPPPATAWPTAPAA